MKALITSIMLPFAAMSVQAADAPKKDAKAVEQKKETDNCVKKDKNGKCPPPPKGEKPTPKKKAEEKK